MSSFMLINQSLFVFNYDNRFTLDACLLKSFLSLIMTDLLQLHVCYPNLSVLSSLICVCVQCDQGIRNLMSDEAAQLATDDPDYAIRDLYNHISEGDFPSWSLKIQVMTFEEAEKFRYNPFDLTKVQCSLLSFIYIHIFVGKILIFNKKIIRWITWSSFWLILLSLLLRRLDDNKLTIRSF